MSAEGFIRLAPERPAVAFTDGEAVEASKAAFYAARLSFAKAQQEFGCLTTRLFACDPVNYNRLKSLRAQTRDAIQKALATEADLTRAIEAMEATLPPRPPLLSGPEAQA